MRIRNAAEEGPSALREAIEQTYAEFEATIAAQQMPMMPLGNYAGLTNFAAFGELADVVETFVPVPELLRLCDGHIDEITEQRGAHPNCLRYWPFPPRKPGEPSQAERNWPIGVVFSLRLKAFLKYFPSESTFYFVTALPVPPDAPPAGADGSKRIGLAWPIGRALVSSSSGV